MLRNTSNGTIMKDTLCKIVRPFDFFSDRYFVLSFAMIWCLVTTLTFLSIFSFGVIWLALLLVPGGIALTVKMLRAEQHQKIGAAAPARRFSRASKCVWKLDSEA